MTDTLKKLEERISILEFKLELLVKLTKNDLNKSLDECRTMNELAFVMNLKKEEFEAINEKLSSQIKFLESINQKTYLGPRQLPKIEKDVDVFVVFSKEEFEKTVFDCIPKLKGNTQICKKIAKINDIYDLYYDELAKEIKKTKLERLDKEAKLSNLYHEYKEDITKIYDKLNLMHQEFNHNVKNVEEIIHFFHENELIKISLFYNGELWEKGEDDKRVVINEDSYIHHVCQIETREVLDSISEALKDSKCPYKELLIHLLNSGTKSSLKIGKLQTFYKTLDEYNKNEYVSLEDMNHLKEELKKHIPIVEELLKSYQEFIQGL